MDNIKLNKDGINKSCEFALKSHAMDLNLPL
jgi:hypothetical protein